MTTQTRTDPRTAHPAEPRTSFDGRLAEIRARGQRRQDRRRSETREAVLDHARRLLAALDFVDQARDVIAAPLAELGRELSEGMTLDQRLFDGRWLVAARLQEPRVDARGRPEGAYSRAAFLLETDSASGRAEVACHLTVHGRDQQPRRLSISEDADGLERLAEFVEERLLAFARDFCSDAPVLRRAV